MEPSAYFSKYPQTLQIQDLFTQPSGYVGGMGQVGEQPWASRSVSRGIAACLVEELNLNNRKSWRTEIQRRKASLVDLFNLSKPGLKS